MKPNRDDLNVRLSVRASFAVTLGLYAGPITKEMIAEHVYQMIQDGGVELCINGWTIEEITSDDDGSLAEST